MSFVQLDGLGFCKTGTAHRFVRDTDITVNGTFQIGRASCRERV